MNVRIRVFLYFPYDEYDKNEVKIFIKVQVYRCSLVFSN